MSAPMTADDREDGVPESGLRERVTAGDHFNISRVGSEHTRPNAARQCPATTDTSAPRVPVNRCMYYVKGWFKDNPRSGF